MKCFKFLILSCFIFTLLLSCCSVLTRADTIKVCPGEQLTLECKSSLQDKFVLEWNVYVPYLNETSHKLYTVNGVRDTKTVEIKSMITLSFNRTSESGDLPLVSQLSINNVSMNLNEIRINCTERDNNNNNIIILTVIHIINSDFEYPHSLQVQKEVKKSNKNNNTTIILEWVQEVGVLYNVSVTPNPLDQESSSSGTKSQLVVLYNTSYHVNIVATLCGNNMNWTTIDVSVDRPATCQYPAINGSSLHISGASGVAVVGTTLAFSCSKPGEVIIGVNTSTCTDDGEWAPDPNQVHLECKVSCGAPEIDDSINMLSSNYNYSILEGSVVTFWCTGHGRLGNGTNTFSSMCHQDGNWMPNPVNQCTTLLSGLEARSSHVLLTAAVSSAVVFLVISVLTLATGVACGYYFVRRRHKQSSSSNQPTEPLYEDVILNALPQTSAVEHHLKQGLKLKENVAYGTAKPTDPLHHEALPSAVEHHLEQGLQLRENVAYGTAKSMTHQC